jgi:endonuclease YncB( thermonuclease family)
MKSRFSSFGFLRRKNDRGCVDVRPPSERNATPELRPLEQQARSTRVGIWGGRDENDD